MIHYFICVSLFQYLDVFQWEGSGQDQLQRRSVGYGLVSHSIHLSDTYWFISHLHLHHLKWLMISIRFEWYLHSSLGFLPMKQILTLMSHLKLPKGRNWERRHYKHQKKVRSSHFKTWRNHSLAYNRNALHYMANVVLYHACSADADNSNSAPVEATGDQTPAEAKSLKCEEWVLAYCSTHLLVFHF